MKRRMLFWPAALVLSLVLSACGGSGGGGGDGGGGNADTTPPTVTATPGGGSYAAVQTVGLSADEPATIYYTVDDSAPTTASAVYTTPLQFASRVALRFFAIDDAGNQSGV